jgi:hypothetical protein
MAKYLLSTIAAKLIIFKVSYLKSKLSAKIAEMTMMAEMT